MVSISVLGGSANKVYPTYPSLNLNPMHSVMNSAKFLPPLKSKGQNGADDHCGIIYVPSSLVLQHVRSKSIGYLARAIFPRFARAGKASRGDLEFCTTKMSLAAFHLGHYPQHCCFPGEVVLPCPLLAEHYRFCQIQVSSGRCRQRSFVGSPDSTSPTESTFVKSLVQGLQRKLAKPTVKKPPVTVAMLEAIVNNVECSRSLADLCLAMACIIGYAALLHFNELVHIRAQDIKVEGGFMCIQIPKSSSVKAVKWWFHKQDQSCAQSA